MSTLRAGCAIHDEHGEVVAAGGLIFGVPGGTVIMS
jgi:hypothetical protein